MKTVHISLNSIDKVKAFVNEITKFDNDFDLVSGRYVIDAKSIMGIFSLDLSKPIELNIHSETNVDEILNILAPYIVDESLTFTDNHAAGFCSCGFLFVRNYSTSIISSEASAASTISSILSASAFSDLRITSTRGLVTGCFATNVVQQSSYGRIEIS